MDNDDRRVSDPLLEKLSLELERLDSVYEDSTPPSLSVLTLQIMNEAVRRRQRQRKEMLLFWMLSLCLIGSCLLILSAAPLYYLMIQAAIPITAFLIPAVFRITQKGQGAEE